MATSKRYCDVLAMVLQDLVVVSTRSTCIPATVSRTRRDGCDARDEVVATTGQTFSEGPARRSAARSRLRPGPAESRVGLVGEDRQWRGYRRDLVEVALDLDPRDVAGIGNEPPTPRPIL